MRYTCIIICNDDAWLNEKAINYANLLFDVKFTLKIARNIQNLDKKVIDEILAYKVDFLFNFLASAIISKEILEHIGVCPINFHPGPPEWPGVGIASYALYHKDKSFGVTAHEMLKTVDSGKIVDVKRFAIFENDTCETLWERTLHSSLGLYYKVLAEIAATGNVKFIDQKWSRKPTTRKQFDEWMVLSLDTPIEEIERRVNALKHSKFSGPTLRIGKLLFRYEKK